MEFQVLWPTPADWEGEDSKAEHPRLAFSAWSLSLWTSSNCFLRVASCFLEAANWSLASCTSFL